MYFQGFKCYSDKKTIPSTFGDIVQIIRLSLKQVGLTLCIFIAKRLKVSSNHSVKCTKKLS